MKNFYEILGIEQTATGIEIKKAYSKLLRKYPPEKEAEKYKEIREAYDQLKDEKSRKNYDTYFTFGEEIKLLEESAKENIEAEKYIEAEKQLKKILIISNDISHIREMLGRVLFYQKKYNECITQFEKLIAEYPENSDYYINLGKAYEERKDFKKAETAFLTSYGLDFSNYAAINNLVYFYINQDEIYKAIKFLNDEIYRDHSLDFDDFYALTQLIECYVFENNKEGVKKTIQDIKRIIPSDEESKKYVSWKLAKLGYQIQEVKFYSIASEVLKLSAELDPQNPDIKNILKISNLYSSMNDLLHDDSIFPPFKGPIYYYMEGESESPDNIKKNSEAIRSSLDSLNLDSLNYMNNSLKIIKRNYKELYSEVKEKYILIEEYLHRQINFVKQLENLLDNSEVTYGLKLVLIALAEKDNNKYNQGIQRIQNENITLLQNSVYYIEKKYPQVYDSFENFFNNIKDLFRNAHNNNDSRIIKKSEGCYIATAIYGDYNAPEVLILRKFRDKILQNYSLGRFFIKTYYKYSPYFAKKLNKTSLVTKIIKSILDKFIGYLNNKL